MVSWHLAQVFVPCHKMSSVFTVLAAIATSDSVCRQPLRRGGKRIVSYQVIGLKASLIFSFGEASYP